MDFDSIFSLCIWIGIILFAVLSLIILFIRSIDRKTRLGYIVNVSILSVSCCAFGFLGITIGGTMGLSTSPVVSVIVPAMITFAGGFVSFLLIRSKEGITPQSQFVAALGLIFLCFFLMKGVEKGTTSRTLYQETHNADGSRRPLETPIQKQDATISDAHKKYLDSLAKVLEQP